MRQMRTQVVALILLALAVASASSAARQLKTLRVVILTPDNADPRLRAVAEAIGYWNTNLTQLNARVRLAESAVLVRSPIAGAVEDYVKRVAGTIDTTSAVTEIKPPRELSELNADIVVSLSSFGHVSFAEPLGPAPCRPARYQSQTDVFFPLTSADRERLRDLYATP